MQRITSRWAAVIVTVAMLVIPVSIQAAPANSDTEATASVWTVVQSWTQSAWNLVEITFDLGPGDDTTDTDLDTTTQTESDDGNDNAINHGIDPNG